MPQRYKRTGRPIGRPPGVKPKVLPSARALSIVQATKQRNENNVAEVIAQKVVDLRDELLLRSRDHNAIVEEGSSPVARIQRSLADTVLDALQLVGGSGYLAEIAIRDPRTFIGLLGKLLQVQGVEVTVSNATTAGTLQIKFAKPETPETVIGESMTREVVDESRPK